MAQVQSLAQELLHALDVTKKRGGVSSRPFPVVANGIISFFLMAE